MSVYDEQAKRFSSLRCEEHDLRSQIITDWELGSNAQRHIQARLVVVAEMNLLALTAVPDDADIRSLHDFLRNWEDGT